MADTVMEAARLLCMPPESDQKFAFELINKLVLAGATYFLRLNPDMETRVNAAGRRGIR